MEPWEQHHAVINMPRFAYNSASLLRQHHVGFLVTCTFRREKSATKETLALLHEFTRLEGNELNGSISTESNATQGDQCSNPCSREEQALPNSVPVPSSGETTGIPCPAQMENSINGGSVPGGAPDLEGSEVGESDEAEQGACETLDVASIYHQEELKLNAQAHEFTLVKLATMGVIYICASRESPRSVINIASKIVSEVQSGIRPAPQWCHRMLPVQATCPTRSEELQTVVSQLVKDHLRGCVPPSAEPLNYAVLFNRRGTNTSKTNKSLVSDSRENCIFGRGECIKTVTAAVAEVTANVKVDLTSPQMVVVVEIIPVAGVQSSLMCAVSVLPGNLVVSKPKLNMKPLTSLTPRSRKRKSWE